LVLAFISVAGFVVNSPEKQTELARDIASVIPVETEFIARTVEGVVSARAITGIAAILGLLWAASAAFGAVRKGINAAWGIRKTRPFLRERLMDFTLVLGAGLLVMSLLLATPAITLAHDTIELLAPDTNYAEDFSSLAARLLTPLLSFLTFLLLYRFLPNTKVTLADVWIGALFASAAFEGANWGFVLYVKSVPIYGAVYGPIGAIMALLTWVYVSAIILLFGAHITSRYAAYAERVRDKQGLKLVWTGISRVRLRVVAST
jgi:membrane protein